MFGYLKRYDSSMLEIADGFSLWEHGKYQKAFEHFEKLVKKIDNNEDIWMGKGLALHGLKKYDEALKAYDKALSINGNYAKIWYNKSLTFEALEDIDSAIASCDKAFELDSNYKKAFKKRELLVDSICKKKGEAYREIYKSTNIEMARDDKRFVEYDELSEEEKKHINEINDELLKRLREDKEFAFNVAEDGVRALKKYRLPSDVIYNLVQMARMISSMQF